MESGLLTMKQGAPRVPKRQALLRIKHLRRRWQRLEAFPGELSSGAGKNVGA